MGKNVILLFLFCAGISACALPREEPTLVAASYETLAGWANDTQAQALEAFIRSCAAIEKKDINAPLDPWGKGRVVDWLAPCAKARLVPMDDPAAARTFFEAAFIPYHIENGGIGLFTGYYEASLAGERRRGGAFQTPLWRLPADMISLRLADFGVTSEKTKLVGKVEDKRFVPYDTRAEVAEGSLDTRAEALAWTDDPVGAFFLEIQGSGRVMFQDGTVLHVGYAGQNGHPYVPIGRVLAEDGEIEKPVTMAKIRDWLARNPARAQETMNKNPSVVFFKEQGADGPFGAMGVALTPLRSMAVDPRFIPLGAPVWLAGEEHRQLVIAQDTGGAIKGPVRGDLFWGYGAQAEEGAGAMQEKGDLYLLLPRTVAP